MKKNESAAVGVWNKVVSYFKKHPIQFNIILIGITFLLFCYIAMVMLDIFTEHGAYKVVPDVKGKPFFEAKAIIEASDFRCEVTDSIYNDTFDRGCVMEQTPKENSKVKSSRTIYLVINAFSPRVVSFPAVCDMSERQAVAKLQEVGFRNILIESVVSPYKGLVIECRYNGLPIAPGKKIPSSSNITLYVGDGLESTDSLSVESTLLDGEIFDSDLESEISDIF